MQNITPLKLPMDAHLKLTLAKEEAIREHMTYQRLVAKLIYFTITWPDIAFSVHILTQFMQHLPKYLARNPGQ